MQSVSFSLGIAQTLNRGIYSNPIGFVKWGGGFSRGAAPPNPRSRCRAFTTNLGLLYSLRQRGKLSPVSCLLSPVSCLLSPVSCLLSPTHWRLPTRSAIMPALYSLHIFGDTL